MLFKLTPLVSLLSFTAIAKAHFVLQIPTNIGFDDAVEDEAPCGSFSPTDRGSGVTDWPEAGSSVALLTTHTQQTWHISTALLSDVTTFVPLIPDISQAGVGTFCLPQVPGNPASVGKDAVLQVIQNSADGTLYQCAAIRFVAGGPGSVPSGCTNSTGISASFVGSGGSSSSSSEATSAASTVSSSTGESTVSSLGSVTTSEAPSPPTSTPEVTSTTKLSGNVTTPTKPAPTPQFTGASNILQVGNFVLFAGGIVALIAAGL